jgi:hypothetical protein
MRGRESASFIRSNPCVYFNWNLAMSPKAAVGNGVNQVLAVKHTKTLLFSNA